MGMHITTKIPDEIQDYEPKVMFGMTGRQLKWSFIALATGFTVYLIGKPFIPDSFLGWIVMVAVILPFMVGWVDIQGMPAWDYFQLVLLWRKRFLNTEYVWNCGSFYMKGDEADGKKKKTRKEISRDKKSRKVYKKKNFC